MKQWIDPYIIVFELLITAGYGFYYHLKGLLGEFSILLLPFKWFLSWLWGVKRVKAGEIAGAASPARALKFVIIRELVNLGVDFLIPKPKKGDIFGFLKEIARTVLKVSLTIIILAGFVYWGTYELMVTTVIMGLVDLFLYRIFEYVMPIFLESIEVPYEGPGLD